VTSAYGGSRPDDSGLAVRWLQGELLDGDYRVERVLGEGGMGVVVAARHVRSGAQVAIKLIRQERVTDPAFLKRFLREASITLQLRGPRVARVLRVGHPPSGPPYLVMEYLEGVTLESLLHERGPLPVAEAVDYVLEACDAIAEAHAMGIVHRDLKPGNLFLTKGPDGAPLVKVIDFGISKMATGATAPAPRSGPRAVTTTVPIGSPSYMSPEQLSEVAVADPRTDVWALGVILFELLTGQMPFDGESVVAVQVSILRDPAPSLRARAPHVPEALDAVIQRCLIKDRSSRVASVHDLVVALAPFASARGRQLAEGLAARAPVAVTTVAEQEPAPVAPEPRWTREAVRARLSAPPRRGTLAVMLVVTVAVGMVGALGLGRRSGQPPVAAVKPSPPATPRATAPEPAPERARVQEAPPAAAVPGAPAQHGRPHTARRLSAYKAAGGESPADEAPASDELFSTRR
jgi:serine/threonine-protein kinase